MTTQAAPILVVRDASGEVMRVPVGTEKLVVGRVPQASIRLDHGMVSRQHAEIWRDEQGQFHIRDLQSRNGTLVNGQTIIEVVLAEGDQIGIGPFSLAIQDHGTVSTSGTSTRIILSEDANARISSLRDHAPPRIDVAHLTTLNEFSQELLCQVAIDATGSAEVDYDGQKLDFGKLRRFTVREAVIEFWQPELFGGAGKPSMDNVRDPGWLLNHSRHQTAGEALADIFERTAESRLIQPTIIYDYPVEISPLSKNKPGERELVERFEIYAAGMEIGNAYTELNDPQEQRRRFDLQLGMREQGNVEAHQMDEDFLRALCYGMPPTAGEGIGIDRVAMLMTGAKSIRDVILFPLLRPEGEIGMAERLRRLDTTS